MSDETTTIETARLHGLLREAFFRGFMLEHPEMKSYSRYPLAGYTNETMRDLLSVEFEDWLRKTALLGTAEGRAIAEAPYVVAAE